MSSNITPIISVIVPAYNLESRISLCLDSILKNTYKDFEVICINDGSTDQTESILLDYQSKYPNIHVYSQPNKGVGPARNLGLSHAKGEFLVFIDGDDFVDPKYLEILISLQEMTKADISVCQIEEVRYFEEKNPNELYEPVEVEMEAGAEDTLPFSELSDLDIKLLDLHKAMKKGYYRCYCTGRMYKRQAIKDITFPSIVYTEDSVYNIHAMGTYENLKMAVCPLPLYYYVYRDDSASHSISLLKRADAIPYYLELAETEKDGLKQREYLEYGIKQILQCRFDQAREDDPVENVLEIEARKDSKKAKRLLFKTSAMSFFAKLSYWVFLTFPKSYQVYRYRMDPYL